MEVLRACSAGALPSFVLSQLDITPVPSWILEGNAESRDLSTAESAVIEVTRGLLQRGLPTLCSPRVERFLANTLPSLQVREAKDEQKIRFELVQGGWAEAFKGALVPASARYEAIWPEAESDAEILFISAFASEVGQEYVQFLDPQRPFASLSEGRSLSRADFAIDSPGGTKYIFEIDGTQHQGKAQVASDAARDAALRAAGWRVLRIPVGDLKGSKLAARLREVRAAFEQDPWLRLASGASGPSPGSCEGLLAVWLPLAVTRIQLALLEAMQYGPLPVFGEWRLRIREGDVPAAPLAVADLLELISHVAALYNVSVSSRASLTWERPQDFDELANRMLAETPEVGLSSDQTSDLSLSVRNLGPSHSSWDRDEGWRIRPLHRPVAVDRKVRGDNTCLQARADSLRYLLGYVFRKRDFWEGQLPILERTLQLKDTVGLLPTGGGKSLTYQMSTLLQPGQAIVVDPLVSLMQDQVEGLRQAYVDCAVEIHGQMSREQRAANAQEFGKGNARFAFIAPERLQAKDFRAQVRKSTIENPISHIVIDEAHCVSEWGHDFRPAYLNVAKTARSLSGGNPPCVIALTGTASRAVLTDMQREIGIDDPEAIITPRSFDRPNLSYRLIKCPSRDKQEQLCGVLRAVTGWLRVPAARIGSTDFGGIVFCRWIGAEFGVQGASEAIKGEFGSSIPFALYSGSKPKWIQGTREDWDRQKRQVQAEFKRNRIPLLVASHAFGMGIDKPNVRYTVHFGIPNSLEGFYQEAGRAGRDGRASVCAVVFSEDNEQRSRRLLDPGASAEAVGELLAKVARPDADDITRVLFFHSQTYRGYRPDAAESIQFYRSHIKSTLEQLEAGVSKPVVVPFAADPHGNDGRERVIYRLGVLGVVEDYTVDWSSRCFELKLRRLVDSEILQRLRAYCLRYKPAEQVAELLARKSSSSGSASDGVESALDNLIWFTYQEIERQRRRATMNLVEALRDSADGEAFRRALLAYLSESTFTAELNQLVERIEPAEWWALSGRVHSLAEWNELLGETKRLLESYPGHPGLMFLSALARLATGTGIDSAVDEMIAGLRLLKSVLSDADRPLRDFVKEAARTNPSLWEDALQAVLQREPDLNLARAALEVAQSRALREVASIILLHSLKPMVAKLGRQLAK
jgi:ATP-dependent DNA helicase RecQ